MTDAPDSQLLDRLYASSSPPDPSERSVKYSLDGACVAFLKSRAQEQNRFELRQYDVVTGMQSLLVDACYLSQTHWNFPKKKKKP